MERIYKEVIIRCPAISIDRDENLIWCRNKQRECQDCQCDFKGHLMLAISQVTDEEQRNRFYDELKIGKMPVSAQFEYLFRSKE